ncbi:hypothetical protein TRAPUB_14080 [Trametes pubescens]|uniref:Uncharacterized protein n=1 Tax=Trametes pubescens TaxID=154538 RepID=A0A1M2VPB6_TRAPU|nr:hypothetical protein TRAPUB_14080 [Trametes pubescens]
MNIPREQLDLEPRKAASARAAAINTFASLSPCKHDHSLYPDPDAPPPAHSKREEQPVALHRTLRVKPPLRDEFWNTRASSRYSMYGW